MSKSKSAFRVNLIQFILYHKWSKVVNSGISYRCELKPKFSLFSILKMLKRAQSPQLTAGLASELQ